MKDQRIYPAIPTREGGEIVVSFPDLPEALTSGRDPVEALDMAADCLAEAIAGRIDDSDEIPAPSPIDGNAVAVPLPEETAKHLRP